MVIPPRNRRSRAATLGLGMTSAILASTLAACPALAQSASDAPGAREESGEQPNIVMILADDLGYTDLGSFGGEAQTPNMDSLAEDGAQFTDFYASPLCAPTRAALMTGQDPHMVGLGSMEGQSAPGVPLTTPGYKGSLEGEFTGIAEVLKGEGYDTYQVGKWHLGEGEGQTPTDTGFDSNFTLHDGGASYFPDALRLFNRETDPVDTVIYEEDGQVVDKLPEDFFTTRSFTDEALERIDRSIESDTPFFTYLGYNAPHDPLGVENEALIDKYLEIYRGKDYRDLRTERIEQMAQRGLIKPGVDIRWVDGTPDWDSLTAGQQEDLARRMAVYSAVIEELDIQVGRLIEHLKDTGEYDNTLIVLASDNGAASLDYKGYLREGRDYEWHERVYSELGNMEAYGQQGSYASIGPHLALASSGPYFNVKKTLFEGGIRVPAVIKAPEGAEAPRQGIVNTFTHITDLYPTFVDYAGGDPSADKSLLGDSVRPLLEGRSESVGDDDFGWELYGTRAYRSGDWKLVFAPVETGGTGTYSLYNLAEDPGETTDVSAQHPGKVAELGAKWDSYAKANGVVPVDFDVVNEKAAAGRSMFDAVAWADGTQ